MRGGGIDSTLSDAPVPLPGLFITGTDTGVGKTVDRRRDRGLVPRGTGQRVARAEAGGDGVRAAAGGAGQRGRRVPRRTAPTRAHPLDLICPQRYAEPLAPAVAAERARQPLDWEAVQRSIDLMRGDSDVMIVEGVGGVMVPLDDEAHGARPRRVARLPAVVVARPGLGTINHTLLTVERASRPRS